MIAIVDYKAGNLTSVKYAFEALGEETLVTGNPEEIAQASKVVFPGVGAAKSAMENLRNLDLLEIVKSAALEKPFLGICLGMQILFEATEEDGGVETLGVIPGRVRRFPDSKEHKVPSIGWNRVEPMGEYFYFVHSYWGEIMPYTIGRSTHGDVEFTSCVKRGKMLACQFHPEKSGRAGLEFLKSWLEIC